MSDGFIVSARKYRPQRFDEVVGQEATTSTLKNAIVSNHLAHSFLFCGSRGVGKTTIARILAKTINCKDLQTDGEACDTCDSCISFNKNASFNIVELDAASKSSVDDIRGLIEQVQYPPQNSRYKVFIIDEVHMLSNSAFNAFLKTLEEPPEYAKFILATTEKHKILPTILSRCQIYDFKRIRIEDIVSHLIKISEKEGIDSNLKALHLIALKADGGLRDALSMFDRLVSIHNNKLDYQDVLTNLNILDYDYYFQIIDAISAEKSDLLLNMLHDIIGKGFDVDTFIQGLSEHIRNLWVSKKESTMQLLEYSEDVKERFKVQSALVSEPMMLNLLQVLSDCEVANKTTRNKRLQVELSLLKMCYINKVMNSSWTDIEEKKKLVEPVQVEPPITSSSPIETSKPSSDTIKATKGLEIQDLINKVTTKSSVQNEINEESSYKVTIDKIDFIEVWEKMKQEFSGDKAQLQLFEGITPIVEGNMYRIKVSNSIQAGLIKGLFPLLRKSFSNITNLEADFECEIDETLLEPEDLTKKEKFEELALKYPLLDQILTDFKLTF